MPMIHDNRYKCCIGCPNRHTACSDRHTACSDRCIDYMIAKATKGAEQQLLRERYAHSRRRHTNGRK